jgi:hypothetical protein
LKTTEGLRAIATKEALVKNMYFSNEENDYVYKAKIDVYGRYFGGILIIKKVDTDSHRVVFTTEFGTKLFDFLYEGDTFTKIFVIDDLDKKLIVNTLQKDFKILISESAKVDEKYISDASIIYRTKEGSRYNFYFFDKEKNRLERIIHSSKRKEKVEYLFASEAKNIAQKIGIHHSNIKLNIDLEYFKKD